MKSRREKSARAAQPAPPPAWPERLRGIFAVLAIGLTVATPFVTSEGAVREGTFAALVTCWCLLLVGWTAQALATPGSRLRFGWTEIVGVLFVAWHSVSALVWLGHGNDRQTLNALWLIVSYGLAVVLLRQLVTTPQRARVLIAVLLWLAATLAATGYVQYFVTTPALRAVYQQDPDRVLRDQGVSTDPQSPQRIQFENRLHSVEPLATFALTNSLAGFLAPWFIVAVAIGLAALHERAQRRTLLGGAVLAALLVGCLLLTKSRTAVLAVLAGMVLLALYGRQSGRHIGWRLPAIGAAALVVLALGVVHVGGLDAEVLSESPKSILYRLEYWRATAALIADHPLWGCGPGNFQESYATYKLPQASEMVADPHNFLLEVWATAGTPGILLLLSLVGAIVMDLSRFVSGGAGEGSTMRTGGDKVVASDQALYFGGAAVGLVLGSFLSALQGFPLDTLGQLPIPVIWWVGFPILPVVWWLLKAWIAQGELPVGAAVVALVVLAINLLAAGAFIFPGVIVTALALVPAALALADNRRAVSSEKLRLAAWWSHLPGDWSLSRAAAGGWCIGAFVLAVLCLWTLYQPVLTSRIQWRNALDHLAAGESEAAEQAALTGATDDPWWPEPWRLVSELRFRRFMGDPSPTTWTDFAAAADNFRARNPRYHGQFFQRGNWHFLAWQRGSAAGGPRDSQPDRLSEALASYREAIIRYPNQALYHGQLGWALAAAGERDASRAAADRAHALDDAMPHTDQKLARRQIADWRRLPTGQEFVRPESAEQTVQGLRTTITRQP